MPWAMVSKPAEIGRDRFPSQDQDNFSRKTGPEAGLKWGQVIQTGIPEELRGNCAFEYLAPNRQVRDWSLIT